MKKLIMLLITTMLLTSNISLAQQPQLPQPNSMIFIGLCSGLEMDKEASRLIGYANCLGRVRGYVDGHQMTIELHSMLMPNLPPMEPLWCVSSKYNDQQVLESVMHWANEHPIEFKSITTQYTGLAGAMAVITKAIHSQFPCQVKKNG